MKIAPYLILISGLAVAGCQSRFTPAPPSPAAAPAPTPVIVPQNQANAVTYLSSFERTLSAAYPIKQIYPSDEARSRLAGLEVAATAYYNVPVPTELVEVDNLFRQYLDSQRGFYQALSEGKDASTFRNNSAAIQAQSDIAMDKFMRGQGVIIPRKNP